jgi:peptide/nickel transport system substrate-binding protein
MNTANPPLDDVHVRQALEHAINQSEFVKVLYKGEAIAARGVMYPETPCYWQGAESVYPFDSAKAKSALEAAGWQAGSDGIMQKDGKSLKLDVVNAFNADLSPLIQAQLKAAGVDANVELVPGPVQLERAIKGDFHLIFQHLAYSDPSVLDLLYNSKNLQPGGWSWTRYKDAKLDQLLSQSTSTIDQTKRCQLLTEAQQIIVNQALVLPIYGRNAIAVMSAKVTDFDLGPRATIDGWLYDAYVQ